MSKDWDLNAVRKLAGLPLMESYDEDDSDEDPDARVALNDKKQREFEKRNSAELSDAAKALHAKKAAKKEPAKEAPKAEPKKPAPKAADGEESKAEPKAEEKAEEKAAEAKRRGKAPNADSKQQKAIAWLRNNPNATRAEFLKHAEEWGMGKNYASSRLGAYRKLAGGKVSECWILSHPLMPGYTLANDFNGKGYRWVSESDDVENIVTTSASERDTFVRYMAEWKNMAVVPVRVSLDDVE